MGGFCSDFTTGNENKMVASLIFLDFKCVTGLCDIARVITFPGFFFQRS